MTAPNDESIRVLHVDDDPDFGALDGKLLEREDDRLEVYTVTTPEEGLAVLHEWAIDCVVSDYRTGARDGLEFRSAVYAEYPELPFVRLSESGEASAASTSRSAAVRDALQDGDERAQYGALATRITNAVERDGTDDECRRRPDPTETAAEGMACHDEGDSALVDGRPCLVYRCRNELGRPMEELTGDVRELTGYSATAVWSGEVSFGTDVTHSDDRADVWAAYKNAVDADGAFDLTYRIVTDGGETKRVWEHGQVNPPTGGVTTFEGFITEVTDLMR